MAPVFKLQTTVLLFCSGVSSLVQYNLVKTENFVKIPLFYFTSITLLTRNIYKKLHGLRAVCFDLTTMKLQENE